jgi:hypothetical protein
MEDNTGGKKMGVLTEYLKTEGPTLKAEKAKRQQVLKDWLDSLRELFAQIQEWLKASDPDNLIEQKIEYVPGKELAFGEYQVPVLKLNLVDRGVWFIPVARFMASMVRPPGHETPIRAQGAVELRGLGGRGYYLFRLPDGTWSIQSEAENLNVKGNNVTPLDAERLEAAVKESF